MPRITRKAKEVVKRHAKISGTFEDLREIKHEARRSLQEAKSQMQAEELVGRRQKLIWAPGGRQAAQEARFTKRRTTSKSAGEGKLAQVRKDYYTYDGELKKGAMVMVLTDSRSLSGGSDARSARDQVVDVMVGGIIIKDVPSIFLEEIEENEA